MGADRQARLSSQCAMTRSPAAPTLRPDSIVSARCVSCAVDNASIAVVAGMMITVLVYGLYGVSGGNLNPAVSLVR